MVSSNPFQISSNRSTGITTGFGIIMAAVTGDTTSDAIDVRDVRWLAIEFTGGGTFNARSGVLSVTISPDDSTYDGFNMLINNVTNDAGAGATGVEIGLTRIASVTRAAVGTDTVFIDATFLAYIKIDLAVTDGGSPTGNFTIKLFGKS